MRLLFKKCFSLQLDRYNVYDETDRIVYVVKGELARNYRFSLWDAGGNCLGYVKQIIGMGLPKFEMYLGDHCVGTICKEHSFFKPKYDIAYKGWRINTCWFEHNYIFIDSQGKCSATVSRARWYRNNAYVIDVANSQDVLYVLMIMLSINTEKSLRDDA